MIKMGLISQCVGK